MSVLKRYLEQIEIEARKVAGIPEAKSAPELAAEALPEVVKMIKQIATTCPDPKVRLDAGKMVVELSEVARREREKRDEQYYAGNPEVLRQLATLPQGEQRTAALQMFADQLMNRTDLDAVLKLIDKQKDEIIKALTDENEKLVRVIEGDEPHKPILNGIKFLTQDEKRQLMGLEKNGHA